LRWGRFVGACGEDYEGKSNKLDEDGAHCGEHYFCDVYDSDMGVILSQFWIFVLVGSMLWSYPEKLLGNGMRYTGFSWVRMCTLGCVCVRSRFFL
jgi:hypothetical protein